MANIRDLSSFVQHPAGGNAVMDLVVDGVKCGGCIGTIERNLSKESSIRSARVNLANKRLRVEWDDTFLKPDEILQKLEAIGYPAFPFANNDSVSRETAEERFLLRCLGVAAFGMMNVMLLSVSVWSGHDTNMSPEVRDLFHWISALIALPVVAYSGRPFFRSALKAIRHGAMNMDVPITLGVLLAVIMSVVQTWQHAEHAYFDSAVMLLLFLLVGRLLDQQMRRRTRDVASNLQAMQADTACKLLPDGKVCELPVSDIRIGDLVLVRPGDRVPVDGQIEYGTSEVDQSLVTGETVYSTVALRDPVYAGSINVSNTLHVRVTAEGAGTLLGEIKQLLQTALEQRSSYVALADKAARLYAPLVHTTALLSFLGWMLAGAGWQASLITAITVLIITCPCALGLAVPAVQVVASGAMFRASVIMNGGDTLERLAGVDHIVFDKTGTLTLPDGRLANQDELDESTLQLAGSLAAASKHPLARAVAKAAQAKTPIAVQEFPGRGVEAVIAGVAARLGSAEFCDAVDEFAAAARRYPEASLIGLRHGKLVNVFAVGQALRSDAVQVVAEFRRLGFGVEIISGDREATVRSIALQLGDIPFQSAAKPADKIARLHALKATGHRVLMVGDGLNDAPALAAADVSLSPITAAHLAQAHADAVFLGSSLMPVLKAVQIARKARRLMLQNLWFSVIYNFVAVPLAIAGLATPLLAAAAMSGSSIAVTLNSLRARNVKNADHGMSPSAAALSPSAAALSPRAAP
jgi:Cu2+-exporting ATPase